MDDLQSQNDCPARMSATSLFFYMYIADILASAFAYKTVSATISFNSRCSSVGRCSQHALLCKPSPQTPCNRKKPELSIISHTPDSVRLIIIYPTVLSLELCYLTKLWYINPIIARHRCQATCHITRPYDNLKTQCHEFEALGGFMTLWHHDTSRSTGSLHRESSEGWVVQNFNYFGIVCLNKPFGHVFDQSVEWAGKTRRLNANIMSLRW